jgi:RNA polymerase sigma-70 factor, ECF subfamily
MKAVSIPTIEEVFKTYSSMVYRICRRYVKGEEDAQDLAQDVFLKLHDKLNSFQGQSSLSTWLYRVTVNICLDHIRSRKNQSMVDVADFDEMVSYNLSASGNAELAKIDLERMLKLVHPKTRELLFLVLAEGLSYAEAGEMVGMEKSAVAKQVTRFLASRSGKAQAEKSGIFHILIAIVHATLLGGV